MLSENLTRTLDVDAKCVRVKSADVVDDVIEIQVRPRWRFARFRFPGQCEGDHRASWCRRPNREPYASSATGPAVTKMLVPQQLC